MTDRPEFLESPPKNNYGKVVKTELRKSPAAALDQTSSYSAAIGMRAGRIG